MSVRAGLAILLGVLLAGGHASGQPDLGTEPGETHGWLGVRSLEGSGGTLLHLPARTQGGSVGAEAGAARQARVLAYPPVAVASWGRRATLFFPGTGGPVVEAYSVRVAQVGVSGAWITEPLDGATPEPVLEAPIGAFADAAGWESGVVVLGREEAWRVWLLESGAWRETGVPMELGEAEAVWLVHGERRPTLLALAGGALSRWRLEDPAAGEWGSSALPGVGLGTPDAVAAVFASAGDVCVVERTAGGASVRALGPNLSGAIADVPLAGDIAGVAPLERGRRLALLSVVRHPEASGVREPIASWELVELSVVSGRELYRGAPRHPSLAIGHELRWLSLAMMAMTVCILFYLLRPVEEGAIALPEGSVLATPARRMCAGLVDAVLVAGVTRAIVGVPLADIVLVAPLFESARGLAALGLLMVLGAVYGTGAEWLSGRTVGKALVGARVVSVDPARARVGLMRSGGRNVFRWFLVPWALLGLGSPGFRHRGDVFAGAAVVVRRREAAGEG